MQKLQPLRPDFQGQGGRACEVAVRLAQARDKPEVHWITRCKEYDWSCLGRRLRRQNRRGRWRDNYSDLMANKISCQCRQLVVMALGPAIFDRDILAFDEPGRFQAYAERAQQDCVRIG